MIARRELLGTLCLVVLASACEPNAPPAGNGPSATVTTSAGPAPSLDYPYQIVTTCAMVTDIVAQVAGEHANVGGLMGEGVDPHMYKPTRNDVKQLLEANVVFYSGLMLEGRMADTFAKVQRQGVSAYPVTEGVAEDKLREPPEFDGHWDPHLWMDVSLWSECVGFIGEALAEFDPTHADDYQAAAAAYREELAKVHEYAKTSVATIPEEQRVLITAHDAFGYFATAYGVEVRSVQGLSTESEAAVQDINNLVDFIVERKIKAIFVESSVSEKNIEAIIEGAAQQDWTVTIGGTLYSDAMGASGTYTGTYVGMMDHNVTVITRALGGEAPEKGLNGKL